MKEQLKQRLNVLKTEFESGQKMLADLEAKQANLRDTLLRISGAIQVLEEMLNETPMEETQTVDNGDRAVEVSVLSQPN
jgi:predicted nuclease with TOPRIM domain